MLSAALCLALLPLPPLSLLLLVQVQGRRAHAALLSHTLISSKSPLHCHSSVAVLLTVLKCYSVTDLLVMSNEHCYIVAHPESGLHTAMLHFTYIALLHGSDSIRCKAL